MKAMLSLLLCLCLLVTPVLAVECLPEDAISVEAYAAVLMDAGTGTLLYGKHADEELPPASVTKVMTLLLVAEAVDSGKLQLTDIVTASANACSMGGSQIWLKEGEQFTVEEMLKCVAVVSANDCAVALAEHISGSEAAFVERMNARAAELGLSHTHFTNCTGLFDDDSHYTSAYDLAVMSRELLSHSWIQNYTTIWMDSIRDGEFGLANTNKLLRSFEGTTGLKTGFTQKAGHCLAATAERDGNTFIAVVLRGESSAARFESCKTLLSYAFANYATVSLTPPEALPPVPVRLGAADSVQPVCPGEKALILREQAGSLDYVVDLPAELQAPVAQGDPIGKLTVSAGGETVAEVPLLAADGVEALGFGGIFFRLVRTLLGGAA